MEQPPRPTIKGIFVKSHVRALEREWGAAGVRELERRFGKPLVFVNTDDVPVSDEVSLLEHIVDMFTHDELSRGAREYEAGRLHFRNFVATPLWSVIETIFGLELKSLLMRSAKIAGYVFQDVEFVSEDLGERSVRITMYNNDYPLEHFQGFFDEMLVSFEKRGSTAALQKGAQHFEYTISWH